MIDPRQIIADAVHDVRTTLRAPLEDRLGLVTRKYFARAVAGAEDECRKELARTDLPALGHDYGLSVTV